MTQQITTTLLHLTRAAEQAVADAAQAAAEAGRQARYTASALDQEQYKAACSHAGHAGSQAGHAERAADQAAKAGEAAARIAQDEWLPPAEGYLIAGIACSATSAKAAAQAARAHAEATQAMINRYAGLPAAVAA